MKILQSITNPMSPVSQVRFMGSTTVQHRNQGAFFMNTISARLILLCLLVAMIPALAQAQSPNEIAAQEVKAAVVAFNQDYQRNDLDAYFSYYRDDATLWFNTGRVTLADYKTMWYQLIKEGGAVQKNEISDLQVMIDPSGDTGIATYSLKVDTRQPDGSVTQEQAHETDVWFKLDGAWRITHIHYSAKPVE